jgi:hypothetical protein
VKNRFNGFLRVARKSHETKEQAWGVAQYSSDSSSESSQARKRKKESEAAASTASFQKGSYQHALPSNTACHRDWHPHLDRSRSTLVGRGHLLTSVMQLLQVLPLRLARQHLMPS